MGEGSSLINQFLNLGTIGQLDGEQQRRIQLDWYVRRGADGQTSGKAAREIMQNWEQLKIDYDARIQLWIQCEAISTHKTVLTGNLAPLVNAVWQRIETEAETFPVLLSNYHFQRTIADVVALFITGKDPFQERIAEATQLLESIHKKLQPQ